MHQGSCGDSVAIWRASGCDGNISPGPESCIDDRVCVAWLLKLYDIYMFLMSLNFKILKTPSGGWTILVATLASHISLDEFRNIKVQNYNCVSSLSLVIKVQSCTMVWSSWNSWPILEWSPTSTISEMLWFFLQVSMFCSLMFCF